MFNKYYEDELAYLRELGAEFARANPAAAPFLAERGTDPDVERLLEGFAFLAGRLRQKLDDELPELTQSLMQMIWPHYLRPVPALSILQFEPLPQAVRVPVPIPAGTEVASVPVGGTSCRFRTTSDVQLTPLQLDEVEMTRPPGTLGVVRAGFKIAPGVDVAKLELAPLRLFLHGDPAASYSLFLQLTRRLRRILVRPAGASQARTAELPPGALTPCGFGAEEALWPYPASSPPGYRLLQEFFALPQKFLFVELALPKLATVGVESAFEVLFEFSQLPEDALRVGADSLRLHCTPVANLFAATSEPIAVEHEKVEYRLRAAGGDPAHFQVFSIDAVRGWARGTADPREYPAFHSFRHAVERVSNGGTIYYQARLRDSVVDDGLDTFVSFVGGDGETAQASAETVVAELTCTNRGLASKLRVGDISRATDRSPAVATFRNITPVVPGVVPPLGGGLHWRLISNLSLNYLSLASVEALRAVLAVYDLQALSNRQAARELELRLAGLVAVRRIPEERVYRGAPIRGTRVEIDINEDSFAGEGEMLLFAGVLNEFLALFATLNSFCRLVVKGVQHGETYAWPPQLGSRQPI